MALKLDEIARIIGRNPSGVPIRDIIAVLSTPMSHRMVQSRLSRLEEMGSILSFGEKSATRYYPVIPPEPKDGKKKEIILSALGREVKELISSPTNSRKPVGYDSDFLGEYVPNQTKYLPEDLVQELHEVGQVELIDLPAGTYVRKVLDRLLIDLAWNSSRLEGNIYSLLETERLLEIGRGTRGRESRETQMIIKSFAPGSEYSLHSQKSVPSFVY